MNNGGRIFGVAILIDLLAFAGLLPCGSSILFRQYHSPGLRAPKWEASRGSPRVSSPGWPAFNFLGLAMALGSSKGKVEELVQGAIVPTVVLSALLAAFALVAGPLRGGDERGHTLLERGLLLHPRFRARGPRIGRPGPRPFGVRPLRGHLAQGPPHPRVRDEALGRRDEGQTRCDPPAYYRGAAAQGPRGSQGLLSQGPGFLREARLLQRQLVRFDRRPPRSVLYRRPAPGREVLGGDARSAAPIPPTRSAAFSIPASSRATGSSVRAIPSEPIASSRNSR